MKAIRNLFRNSSTYQDTLEMEEMPKKKKRKNKGKDVPITQQQDMQHTEPAIFEWVKYYNWLFKTCFS